MRTFCKAITVAATLLMLAASFAVSAGDSGTVRLEPPSNGTTIYKVVHPDGTVTFSDTRPASGKVEKIQIGPTNVQRVAANRPLPTRKLSPRDKTPQAVADTRPVPQGPISFSIVSPANDATITPGQRFIVLEVAINPLPVGGHQFFAVVDGQPWQGGSSGTSLDLSALERGSHQISAVLTDMNGQVLARSQTITVHVKRPSSLVPDFAAPRAPQAPKAPPAQGLIPNRQPRR